MFKLHLLIGLITMLSSLIMASSTQFARISGHTVNGGYIYGHIYQSDETFLNMEKSYKTFVVNSESKDLFIIMPSLTPGDYAITLFQDQNNNKVLDANFIGIPKEPVALSNNHRPRFGPPKFLKAKVTIPSQNITLDFNFN